MSLIGCVLQAWRPQIGDPEVTGLLTVVAYLLCAGLSVQVWRRLKGQPGRGFWGVMTVLMLLLAINKQLDLQSAMTALGRCMALAQGWYEGRRPIQVGVIIGLLMAMVMALLVGLRLMQGQVRQNVVAVAGLAVLCGFVGIRAIGFHHMDALIGHREFGVSTNYLLENAGLVLIALNAVMLLRRG